MVQTDIRQVSSFLNTLNKNVRENAPLLLSSLQDFSVCIRLELFLCCWRFETSGLPNDTASFQGVREGRPATLFTAVVYISRTDNALATKIALNETKAFEDLDDTDQSAEADSSSDSESDSSSDTDEDGGQNQQNESSSKFTAESSESNDLELPKILEMIRFLITCLYKMPIRRPAALERLKSRLSDNFTAYREFDILFVRDLHPDLETTIATRLGSLVSLRRQIIEYREEHNERMQPRITTQVQSFSPVLQVTSENLDTTKSEQAVDATVSEVKGLEISLPSKATTHRNTLDHPEFKDFVYPPSVAPSETSRASSYAVGKIKIGIPNMPRDSNGMLLTHFVCPYCSIAVTLRSEKLWKKHVLADLKPYVCSFSGCTLQDHFFAGRKEWYQHETQEHRLVWHCNVEQHDRYHEQTEFLDHMSQSHDVTFLPDQVASIAPMFRCPDRSSEGKCNMCFRHSKNLRSHVARHLERIALFALPRWYNEDANSQSSEGQGSQRASSSGDERGAALDTDDAEGHVSASDSASSATVRDVNMRAIEDDDDPVNIQENPVPDSDEMDWDSITKKFSHARLPVMGGEGPGINLRLNLTPPPTKDEKDHAKEFLSLWRPDGQESQIALLRLVPEARLDAFEDCIESIAQVTATQATDHDPNSRDGRTLYLCGRPGWGKTTLIKHLSTVNMLRRAASQRYSDASSRDFSEIQLVVAAYYFDNSTSSYRGLLQSLLHQILRQRPGLLFRIGYSRTNGMHNVEYPTAVSRALEMLQDSSVWILLDGIDEVGYQVKSPVFRFLGKLRLENPNLTICVTGTEGSPDCLVGLNPETLELADRAADLKKFMANDNSTGTAINDLSQVESIIDCADGLFLPLHILFDLIQTQNSSVTLHTLPRSFRTPDEFFEDVFQSFSQEAQKQAATIILLMLGLERPRFLTLVARYSGRRDDARQAYPDHLVEMGRHGATELIREMCPFVHIYYGDKHLEARFSHGEIARYLKSATGKALLQSCVSRDDDIEYHYHVDVCEALLAEISLYPEVNKEALTDFAYWMKQLDRKDGLCLQRWDLLNNLRDTLELYQNPKARDITRPTHPEFWKYFPSQNNLVSLLREHGAKLGNSELLASHLGLTSNEEESVDTEVIIALLESGLDINAIRDGTERSLWHAYLAAALKDKKYVDQRFQTVQAMIRYGAQFEGHIDGEDSNEKVEIRSILRHMFSGQDEFRRDQSRGSTRFLILESIAKERGKSKKVPSTIWSDPATIQPRDGG